MTLPGHIYAVLHELLWYAPCTALVLLARRLPAAQVRTVRLHFASPIVCGIVVWIGTFAGAAAALTACCIEATFLLQDRASRRLAIKSGLALAIAAVAAGSIAMTTTPRSLPRESLDQLCLSTWQQVLPILLTFLAVYGAANVTLFSPTRKTKSRQRTVSNRERITVTIAGFVALAMIAPLGTVVGPWILLPLVALLSVVAFIVHRSLQFRRLEAQLSVSQAMGLASLADAATAEPTALLYRFLHLAENLIHAERGVVWMVDDIDGAIVPAVGLPDMGEYAGIRSRLGEGLIGTAAERMRPLIVSDAARTLRRGENEPAADSWLLYPILSQKKILGVAHWTRSAANPFTLEDAEQLEGLVPQVGVAVESLRARNKMRELASTDGLTGLLNHRRIGKSLRDEMRRAERYNRPLSVLMLDVDSFKSFNDTHGHVSGDDLLRSVAQVLRTRVRTVDKIGRYGGEEFLIVMPETHKDDAYLLAERIRSAVEQNAFVIIAGEPINRTVSVGVASYPEDGLNPQEVVERADDALYRAKDAGKNCVVWA